MKKPRNIRIPGQQWARLTPEHPAPQIIPPVTGPSGKNVSVVYNANKLYIAYDTFQELTVAESLEYHGGLRLEAQIYMFLVRDYVSDLLAHRAHLEVDVRNVDETQTRLIRALRGKLWVLYHIECDVPHGRATMAFEEAA